jgi:hypothetical protein
VVQALHRVAQRLGFLLGQAPELFVASARIVAAARACAQASFVAAMAKRSEQVALRALGQIFARLTQQRPPLIACAPAGIVGFGHVNSFLIGASLFIRPRDSGGGGPPEGRRPRVSKEMTGKLGRLDLLGAHHAPHQ